LIFLDASAAAKRYCQEQGSSQVEQLVRETTPVCSVALLRCELTSVLNRKRRDGDLSNAEHHAARERVTQDLSGLRLVPVDDELIDASVRLLDAHPLKTVDSLYLAGALSLQQLLNAPVLFVSADRQLLRAAQAEKLKVLDPERAV
jgi:predicted nucleic acid-binding protein